MNKSLHTIMYLLLAVTSGIAGYLLFQSRYAPESAEIPAHLSSARGHASMVGLMRPDFSLPDLEGRQHVPGEWSGKILVLNFWATWCPPCLQEIPAFIRLQEKYASRDVQFVGIALQKAEEVRDFVITKGINYPILTGEAEVIGVAEAYGNSIGALPYTVIIDQAQRIAFIKRGPLPESEAERVISSLVVVK